MKKIVIIGSTLSGNKGAAAMLEAAIQTINLKNEKTSFTLLSYLPEEYENRLNKYNNLQILKASPLYLGIVINTSALLYRILPPIRPLLSKLPQIRAIEEADVYLDQGGITFVDGREKFLLYNVASILPAIMMKKPIVKCAQALGPFNGRLNKAAAKYFLPKITKIYSRGRITHDHLTGLGLTNLEKGADYAFSLEVSDKERKIAEKYYPKDFFKSKKIVGISPSVVMRKKIDQGGGDYTKTIADTASGIIKKGYRVILLPHSARKGVSKTHNNDLPLCIEINKKINNKDCLLIDEELSSQELRAIIGKCDFFIASRFHAMVSSLSMKVPTIVLGWSHKYEEVLEMFDLEEWAFGSNKSSSKFILRKFDELEKNESAIRKKLTRHLPGVKKLSIKQADGITKIIS